jgi:hypothetical protein
MGGKSAGGHLPGGGFGAKINKLKWNDKEAARVTAEIRRELEITGAKISDLRRSL